MKDLNKHALVREIAKRGHFTVGDSQIFLDTLISIFEDAVRDGSLIDVRGLGHLYYTRINRDTWYDPQKRTNVELQNDEAIRIGFQLSKNLRDPQRYRDEEDYGDLFDVKE